MRVRAARVGDGEEIAQVHVASWRVAYRNILSREILAKLDVAKRAAAWRTRLAEARMPVLVLEDEAGICGFCAIDACQDDDLKDTATGEILAIYLDPRVSRRGGGRLLCARACEELRARGFAGIVLWAMEGNRSAHGFYAAMRFTPDGARRRHPGLGVELMRFRREPDCQDS